jgi:hypothetical protein
MSFGLDQLALTTLTHALSGCSASDRPGRLQKSRNVLTAMIRNG